MSLEPTSIIKDGDALVFTFREGARTHTVRIPDSDRFTFGYRGFRSRFLVGGSPERVDRQLAEGDHVLTFFGAPRQLTAAAVILTELGRRRDIRIVLALEERHGQTVLVLFAHDLMFDVADLKQDANDVIDAVNDQLPDFVFVEDDTTVEEEDDPLERIGEAGGPGIYYEEDMDLSGVDFVPASEVGGP